MTTTTEKAIEALRLGINALTEPGRRSECQAREVHAVGIMRRTIVELEAERAAPAEPVAWRTFDGEGGYDYRTYEGNENYADEWAKRNPKHVGWVEPLYAAPAAPAEPVAEFRGRRLTPEGTVEFWGVMLCDPMQDPPKGAKLYLGPVNDPVPSDWRSVIPGGRFTDKWESCRVADFNEGWNAYRKAAIANLYATPAAPAPDLTDAYAGAREDLAIWKRRALEAEDLNRMFMREVNGPTFMGEPALAAAGHAPQPLNFDQLQRVMAQHFGGRELTDDEADSAEAFARAIERAHGIRATKGDSDA